MIQLHELRIGNWVLGASRGLPQQVTAAMLYQFDKMNIQPIHITPEILEKVGFKLGKGKFRNCGNPYYTSGKFYIMEWRGEWMHQTPRGVGLRPKIKYVHQLQNLYFALVGKELEISF